MSENTVKKRNVNFPENDSQLVTATYGPEDPWFKDEEVTSELLITKYKESCIKHGVQPLPQLLLQLQKFDYSEERLPRLDLSGTQLEFLTCESLEEVLKRVRFDIIDLENTNISEEGAVALFEMVEYYEACQTLNMSRNVNILARGWQACSRMIKKTQSLRELIAKETCLKEEFIPFLTRTLKIGTHLSVLNLERCKLNGRPITMLANSLRMNRSLQEIYLGENQLESMDAYNLSNLLTHNSNLQLLDLSNNLIGDKGAQHLCLCLAEKVHNTQRSPQSPTDNGKTGLLVLVLWNNSLTHLSGQHFAKLVEKYNELEVLNVGHNNLTDAWLRGLREPLKNNHSLYLLGLQSTKLSIASAKEMATVFEHNTTLQRVDLRENHIGIEGLQELCRGLESNVHLTQLDLDQNPAYIENPEEKSQYEGIFQQIIEKLKKNSEKSPPPISTSKLAQNLALASRKISLTCEIKIPQHQAKKTLSSGRLRSPAPSPTPSPILSPIPSPGGKSRFSVSRVQDPVPKVTPQIKTSRFSITPVKDIPKIILPEEKITVGFQITPENTQNVFKFDNITNDENTKNSNNLIINEKKENQSTEIIIKNDENFNFDNNDCDSEVECITSNIKDTEDGTFINNSKKVVEEENKKIEETIISSKKSYNILEFTSKTSEKLETVTEINPAFIDTVEVIQKPGILSKRSKISNTYPPRLDDNDIDAYKAKDINRYSDNSQQQISKNESKTTLQNLFALFQTPSLSFSSTASAFYAKTEAKMSQIVPSLSSITLNYEPFKFHTKSSSKTHLSDELVVNNSSTKSNDNSSDDDRNQSSKLINNSDNITQQQKQQTENELLESKLEIRMGKKRKSKKKNIVDKNSTPTSTYQKKGDDFWDFGDENNSDSVPSTSD